MSADNHADVFSQESDIDQCRAYLVSQLEELRHPPVHPEPGPAVTISFQTGSGEHDVARKMAAILQGMEMKGHAPWTVFDRQLIETVLREHDLPTALARRLTEERRSFLKNVVEEVVGLRPPSWVVVPQIAETVLHLADAGYAIIVGRGSAFITARMPNVFHLRLVAPVAVRIERVQRARHLSEEAAARFVEEADRRRGAYLKTHYHVHEDDSLLYHLVINTGLIPCPDAAEMAVDAARKAFKRLRQG